MRPPLFIHRASVRLLLLTKTLTVSYPYYNRPANLFEVKIYVL